MKSDELIDVLDPEKVFCGLKQIYIKIKECNILRSEDGRGCFGCTIFEKGN